MTPSPQAATRPTNSWPITLGYATARSPLDHFATYPLKLVEKLILTTTDEGDLVLDPFAGTATTGVAAIGNGRRFIGIELNLSYAVGRFAKSGEVVKQCLSRGLIIGGLWTNLTMERPATAEKRARGTLRLPSITGLQKGT